MAFYNENSVVTGNVIVLWDGVNHPEKKEDGSLSYNLKFAFLESGQDAGDINALAQQALGRSKWAGQLPPGGKMPVLPIDMTKFTQDAARLNGHIAANANTKFVPPVLDANGQPLQALQYSQQLYPGAVVRVLIGTYEYDAKGNKGIALSLNGIQIMDSTAPRLAVGGGMSANEVAGAFGASGGTAAPVQTPTPTPTPAHDFVQNAGAPTPEPSYTVAGQAWPKSALVAQGWTEAQLATLPQA